MRLINVNTMQMRSFLDTETPNYAILSHRWGEEETSFQEYHRLPWPDSAGCRKIQQFCTYIRQAFVKIEWVWIDTCCIDKTSSAELSETINSMWRYYSQAMACIAYLNDVTATRCGSSEHVTFGDLKCHGCLRLREEFAKSEYFQRGWTLQELIAPKVVTFMNRNWKLIGRKDPNDRSLHLMRFLHEVTRIDIYVLGNPHIAFYPSVAQRLSWAANRKTTRTEDAAYSLFGLLGLHLPLLYGEGTRAWDRMLRALLEISSDESIFTGDPISPTDQACSFFPRSAAGYAQCSSIVEYPFVARKPYRITNQGLEMHLEAGAALFHRQPQSVAGDSFPGSLNMETLAIRLNCLDQSREHAGSFLMLQKWSHMSQWVRENPSDGSWRKIPVGEWKQYAPQVIYISLNLRDPSLCQRNTVSVGELTVLDSFLNWRDRNLARGEALNKHGLPS